MYKDVKLFGKKYRLTKLALGVYYGVNALGWCFAAAGLYIIFWMLYAMS